MAPSPLPVYVAVISKAGAILTRGLSDRIFFVLLRGTIPSTAVTTRGTPIDNAELAKATLSFSMTCNFPDGTHDQPKSYCVPLRTVKAAETAHFAIRDAEGAYTEHMTVSRYNDIMGDMWISGMFLRTGEWTFEVVAQLEDETCLFAMTLTQYLKGEVQDPL
ncbi:hypothetical protein Slin15195_G002770 [Septoria linicola]|uniref:Uncharacterized protein n=1 Tax=Septoria linicola TaxID=215465 RepID=A0A9Q9AHG6_9PEZI|nr:hypothetical protein Slin15195_G002770 [Septoria linicola]